MEYRLSDKLNTIISLSKEEAERLMHAEVTANHLLLGMLRDGQNKAVRLLSDMGVDLSELRMRLASLGVDSPDGVFFQVVKLVPVPSEVSVLWHHVLVVLSTKIEVFKSELFLLT